MLVGNLLALRSRSLFIFVSFLWNFRRTIGEPSTMSTSVLCVVVHLSSTFNKCFLRVAFLIDVSVLCICLPLSAAVLCAVCMFIRCWSIQYTLHPMETLQLRIGKMAVESVAEHKVLGLVVDRNLNFNSHAEALVK